MGRKARWLSFGAVILLALILRAVVTWFAVSEPSRLGRPDTPAIWTLRVHWLNTENIPRPVGHPGCRFWRLRCSAAAAAKRNSAGY